MGKTPAINPEEDRSFTIGPLKMDRIIFNQVLGQFPPLREIANADIIEGPFDGKINSIYKVKIADQTMIVRMRVSRAFRYEPIVKEKILYPLLDRTLNIDTPNLRHKIKEITHSKHGQYEFSSDKPPVVPVQDLLYYYEPNTEILKEIKEKQPEGLFAIVPPAPFPYLTTIKEFMPGCSFYEILNNIPNEEKNSNAILSIFEAAGEMLGKLHTIKFDAFYEEITDIGSHNKPTWEQLFNNQWEKNFQDAAQYKAFKRIKTRIEKYFQENKTLASNNDEPVLFHNDYQSQNIIVDENKDEPYDSPKKYRIIGIIDFDNWRIGPRSQDFIKMEYWTIKDNLEWLKAFRKGYSKIHPISGEMSKEIKLYKMLWFMLVYAFEMDKIKKNEQNLSVDQRFPAAEKYIEAMEDLLEEEGY